MEDTARSVAEEQAALWNGPSGQAWVETQDLTDRMFRPFEELLAEAVAQTGARRVLDIGCGAGSTTLAIARRLGSGAECVGLDISAPLVAAARESAAREGSAAQFLLADAQTHAFEPASFDVIVSRFGVMFFGDPVQAFVNLRGAVRPGGELCLIVWRSASDNPFMKTAERAAAPLLPNMPPRRPTGPGQFAFGDPEYVSSILTGSGWVNIGIQPLDVPCVLPEKDLILFFTRLGPVGLALQEVDANTRARVIETVRTAFDPYVQDGQVRYTAACWMVRATAPAADR